MVAGSGQEEQSFADLQKETRQALNSALAVLDQIEAVHPAGADVESVRQTLEDYVAACEEHTAHPSNKYRAVQDLNRVVLRDAPQAQFASVELRAKTLLLALETVDKLPKEFITIDDVDYAMLALEPGGVCTLSYPGFDFDAVFGLDAPEAQVFTASDVFRVALPIKVVVNFVKLLPKGAWLTLVYDRGVLRLSSGKYVYNSKPCEQFHLAVQETVAWVQAEGAKTVWKGRVDASGFYSRFMEASKFASLDHVRPSMEQIAVITPAKRPSGLDDYATVELHATDGHKAYVGVVPSPSFAKMRGERTGRDLCGVHLNTARGLLYLLKSVCKRTEAVVDITMRANEADSVLKLQVGNAKLRWRWTDARFPNIHQVMPPVESSGMVVDSRKALVRELAKLIKATAPSRHVTPLVWFQASEKGCKLHFRTTEGTLESAYAGTRGVLSGQSSAATYDARILLSLLKALTADVLRFHQSTLGEESAPLLTVASVEETGVTSRSLVVGCVD